MAEEIEITLIFNKKTGKVAFDVEGTGKSCLKTLNDLKVELAKDGLELDVDSFEFHEGEEETHKEQQKVAES